jgi:hypothetical protein
MQESTRRALKDRRQASHVNVAKTERLPLHRYMETDVTLSAVIRGLLKMRTEVRNMVAVAPSEIGKSLADEPHSTCGGRYVKVI